MKFKDKDIESFWNDPVRQRPRRVSSSLAKPLFRKLQMLEAANDVNDLRIPPGNRLEALKGDRKGQYSIRVNEQWRLCFTWTSNGAEEVEFCDYHS